jgi:hypothetical protein
MKKPLALTTWVKEDWALARPTSELVLFKQMEVVMRSLVINCS